MNHVDLRVDIARLTDRVDDLAELGTIGGNGVCRLGLTPEDKAGRDRVLGWMPARYVE